jgi:hypothetical protein
MSGAGQGRKERPIPFRKTIDQSERKSLEKFYET